MGKMPSLGYGPHTPMLSLEEVDGLIAKYRRLRGAARQTFNETLLPLPEAEIVRIRQRAAATCSICPKCRVKHEVGEPCLT
jgi:hypothetical protein